MTTVCFRKERDGEVLAVFPYVPASKIMDDLNVLQCYSHTGQHSVCDWEYLRYYTNPAKKEEARALLEELEGQGYTDLRVLSRLPNWYHIHWFRIMEKEQ